MIKIYVYDKETKQYLYDDSGNPDYVIHDIGTDKDFTMTPLPISESKKPFRWIDNKWVQDIEEGV